MYIIFLGDINRNIKAIIKQKADAITACVTQFTVSISE